VKLALVADVHANLPALEVVLEDITKFQPDAVVVLGDTVNRGPDPLQCWQRVALLVSTAGWQMLIGNHEEYVISVQRSPDPPGSTRHDVHRHTHWTAAELGESVVAGLAALPAVAELASPAGRASFTHGSLLGSRDGVYPDTSEAALRAKIDAQATLFGVGHTHRPLVRALGETLVVNAGSVGMPFDGDHRPAYARAQATSRGWEAGIKRLDYDWQATRSSYRQGAFAVGSGEIGRVICREFELARPLLAAWTDRYAPAVLAGSLTIAQSVTEFLRDYE
jgi:predicted phosphodiesterase